MMNTKLSLPPLPYDYDALEPVISKKIMELHHDKHHAAYVNNANADLDKLEQIRAGNIAGDLKGLLKDFSFNYNGAALHDIFWQSMRSPQENNGPDEKVRQLMDENFGSFESFTKEFSDAAKSVEGSGWAVLWKDKEGHFMVGQLEKHNLLGLNDTVPVLVLDVWEHAYYLDYLNDRASYVEKWWQVVNWDYVRHVMGEVGQMV
jgi:Fe-Mn family superoxide dismutase